MRGVFSLLRQAFSDWNKDNAGRLGATLSYYTLFSLAPLLIVAIAVDGLVFGQDAAQGRIVAELRGLVGEAGAQAIQDMIENSRQPAAGMLATVIGVVTLFLGATGAFAELKSALNIVKGRGRRHPGPAPDREYPRDGVCLMRTTGSLRRSRSPKKAAAEPRSDGGHRPLATATITHGLVTIPVRL